MPDTAQRTAQWQRQLVRDRVGAVFDPQRARALAEQAIREEAGVKNHPPDLINLALEVLVRESLELPGFSTLNETAARIRAEVNQAMFDRILARMGQLDVQRINALLEVVGPSGKSRFDALKRAAGRASWSNFREQVAHMVWGRLWNTGRWLHMEGRLSSG
jgi:hypothetical protein